MQTDRLTRLISWYDSNCNGRWEHHHGVQIDTLDNPGWLVTISTVDTANPLPPEGEHDERRSRDDWINWRVEDHTFKGAGGPRNLPELIDTFLDLADRVAK